VKNDPVSVVPPPPPFKAYDAVRAYDEETVEATYEAVEA
jgi:hypothetical protein